MYYKANRMYMSEELLSPRFRREEMEFGVRIMKTVHEVGIEKRATTDEAQKVIRQLFVASGGDLKNLPDREKIGATFDAIRGNRESSQA